MASKLVVYGVNNVSATVTMPKKNERYSGLDDNPSENEDKAPMEYL